ncbi:MAG: VanZ family protein, partial [Actinomyces sp.]|nr:VanZ family protein [Actinomyces sp.]
MYTAINWGLDLGLYAAVCAIVCALWWLLGRRGNPSATAGRAEASTDSAQSSGRVSRAGLTVAQALPLIYRRSKRTGALLPREENPDTPTTAEIPVVAAPSSSMWRLPRALPLAWILYLAGLLIFTLLPLPSDPVAACAAIIHWDNYVPFGSFVAVADQF